MTVKLIKDTPKTLYSNRTIEYEYVLVTVNSDGMLITPSATVSKDTLQTILNGVIQSLGCYTDGLKDEMEFEN